MSVEALKSIKTMSNEHEVLINIVELASELADAKLRKDWDYRDGDIDVEEDDEIRYTETAQDIFNDLYDIFYNAILLTKV